MLVFFRRILYSIGDFGIGSDNAGEASTKALITGIGGFVGGHLTEYLLAENVEVYGILRHSDSPGEKGHPAGLAKLFYVDLNDAKAVSSAIKEVSPQLIFHLAAQASVPKSWQDPSGTLTNNVVSQLNVLLGVIESGIKPRILILGSNEEYGSVRPDEVPIAESHPLRPINPYAVSKVAQDLLGYQYFVSHGIECIRVRPFNHIGPRQTDAFVVAAFAKQIAEAEAGLQEPIVRVGNLEAQRDFSDVRDIVHAYHLAATKGQPGEVYNIGSGKAVSVKWILEFLVSLSKTKIRVEVDPNRFRPVDQPITICDASKFRQATGWTPRIPLEQTLAETLDYWRQTLKRSGGGADR